MGFTNNVQPYCRLAIIAMQTTPSVNCHQRPRRSPTARRDDIDVASVTINEPMAVVLQRPAVGADSCWNKFEKDETGSDGMTQDGRRTSPSFLELGTDPLAVDGGGQPVASYAA